GDTGRRANRPAADGGRPFSPRPKTSEARLYTRFLPGRKRLEQNPLAFGVLGRGALTPLVPHSLSARFRKAMGEMTTAFVFPGQGSQAVGMGKTLADQFVAARAVFDEIDAALDEKLTRTMWEGPADKLTLTENTQPALLAVSLAALRVL